MDLAKELALGFDIAAEVAASASNSPESSGYAVITTSGSTLRAFAKIDLSSARQRRGGSRHRHRELGDSKSEYPADVRARPEWPLALALDSTRPDYADAVQIGAITSGESLVDIDFRPLTGQLYGLGIDPIANTGSLYVIVPATGAVSLVGSASQIALVDSLATPIDFPADATTWSIDFDPNVDRLRVMNSTGLNFRVNPISGIPVDGNSDTAGPIEPDQNSRELVCFASSTADGRIVPGNGRTSAARSQRSSWRSPQSRRPHR
jgi:hypothetical protein